MQRYCGIGLHSNNSVVSLINDNDCVPGGQALHFT